MINSKAMFIVGSAVGALATMTSMIITAKIFNACNEDEKKHVDEERAFFIISIKDYMTKHEIENVDDFVCTIEDVCDNFSTDYRKFLITMYDFIIRDDCDQIIEYLESIQNILSGYASARWMDTEKAIKSIINGEPIENDVVDEDDEELNEEAVETVSGEVITEQ